jgi:TolB-like protein
MLLVQRCLAAVVATSVCLSSSGYVSAAIPPPIAAMAPAAGAKLAILPLRVDGGLSESDQAELTKALIAGLQRGNFTVVPPEQVVAAEGRAASCDGPTCIKNVAAKTGSAYVVRVVVVVKDRDYTVKVELVAADGKRLAQTEDGCEICGVVDASGLIDSAAATLRLKLDALSKGPAAVKLTSDPRGAIVTIDGQIAGTTPLDRPVVPGKHLIRVDMDGYISIEREVTFVEGVNEDLAFTLEKLPSRLPGRRWGFVSLGVGIVALGGAIGFGILDEKPFKVGGNCSDAYMEGDRHRRRPDFNYIPNGDMSITGSPECARLWRTEPIAIPLAVVGGALLTLGIAILVNSRKKTDKTSGAKRSPSPSAAPVPASASASAASPCPAASEPLTLSPSSRSHARGRSHPCSLSPVPKASTPRHGSPLAAAITRSLCARDGSSLARVCAQEEPARRQPERPSSAIVSKQCD